MSQILTYFGVVVVAVGTILLFVWFNWFGPGAKGM